MDIEKNIIEGIKEAVEVSFSIEKIKENYDKHRNKIHFLPVDMRVFSGGIQSLNIKLGNILVDITADIIERNPKLELHELSGKKIKKTNSIQTRSAIDDYMTDFNSANKTSENDFNILTSLIYNNEPSEVKKGTKKVDVDLLFINKDEDKIYFFESKAVDDHDTGKFDDINRKVFATYGALLNELRPNERHKLVPNLMYFSERVRYDPIYIPKNHQFRGRAFFKNFLDYDLSELDTILIKASDAISPYIKEKYKEIVIDQKYNA
tara:strand:- start:1956 stop:2747 length:792 start_codon:yes stop_codon:yes gene_type:complete